MDLMRRLHRNFRESPAPHLRALTAALERGMKMLGLRGFVAGMYLEAASEDALAEWADTYGIETAGLDDASVRGRLQGEALSRNRTTQAAIEAAILARTGFTASVRSSELHVARLDQGERAAQGYRMADHYRFRTEARGVAWGGAWGGAWPDQAVVYGEDDPSHLAYRGLVPAHGAFGPGGFIVYLAQPYDAAVEAAVLTVLADSAPAAAGYSLFWAHTFTRRVTDTLRLSDQETQHPLHGYGCAPWGRAYGSPLVTAEACPASEPQSGP